MVDLTDKENGYHRIASNPTAAFGNDDHSKISHGYDSGK